MNLLRLPSSILSPLYSLFHFFVNRLTQLEPPLALFVPTQVLPHLSFLHPVAYPPHQWTKRGALVHTSVIPCPQPILPAPIMSSPIFDAINTLSRVLEELNVTYAILGGAACLILGSQRITNDIDLVIGLTDTVQSADELVKTLCKRSEFVALRVYGVEIPALKCDDSRSNVPLEIFDPELWKAQAPHFTRVAEDRVEYTLPSGTTTYIFPPTWLLREKMCTIQRRGHTGSLKFDTDSADIHFLTTVIKPDEENVGFLDFTTQDQASFLPYINDFLAREEVEPSLREVVGSKIRTA